VIGDLLGYVAELVIRLGLALKGIRFSLSDERFHAVDLRLGELCLPRRQELVVLQPRLGDLCCPHRQELVVLQPRLGELYFLRRQELLLLKLRLGERQFRFVLRREFFERRDLSSAQLVAWHGGPPRMLCGGAALLTAPGCWLGAGRAILPPGWSATDRVLLATPDRFLRLIRPGAAAISDP
jgi:hypothetical protein